MPKSSPVVAPAHRARAAAVSNWSQYRGNAARTGFASWTQHLPAGNSLWRCDIPGLSYSSPVVGVNGTIYIGTADANDAGGLVAVGADGKIAWTRPLAADGFAYGVLATPAVRSDGSIVVVAFRQEKRFRNGTFERWQGFGRLFLLAPDGTILHTTGEYDGHGWTSPAIDAGDNTYFLSRPPGKAMPWCVFKIDRDFSAVQTLGGFEPKFTSENRFEFPPQFDSAPINSLVVEASRPRFLYPSPALTDSREVIATCPSGTLRCWATGGTFWTRDLYGSTPAVGRCGRAYIAAGNHLEAWNQKPEKRNVTAPATPPSNVPLTVNVEVPFWAVTLTQAADDPPALAPSDEPSDRKYEATCEYKNDDGTLVHMTDHRTPYDIYVAAGTELCAVDFRGRIRWKKDMMARRALMPVVIEQSAAREQCVISGARDIGYLVALNRNGDKMWELGFGGPIRGSLAAPDGRVYVANDHGLYAII